MKSMNLVRQLLVVWALAQHAAAFPATVTNQVSSRPHPHSDNSNSIDHSDLDQLHAWADSREIYRQVIVHDEPSAGGGRGLVALRDLAPGEVAVRVPLSATIRLGGSDSDNDNDKIDMEEDDNWAGILASKLCHEDSLGVDSAFWEYLQIGLPSDCPRTICRWTSSERLALQDDALVNESFENAAWRRRQLTNYRSSRISSGTSTTAASGPVSNKKFFHYLDLVCSRTLKGRVDGSRNLVPIIDNANHCPTEAGGGAFVVDNNTHDGSNSICLMVGNRGVKAGEAVTLDYGGRRSEDYLLHYGFVPDRCPSDSISVMVNTDAVSDNGNNNQNDDMATVRWDDCRGFGGHPDEKVRTACAALLESYETTLGEDNELLRNVGRDSRNPQNEEARRAALNYRIAKKSLLSQAAGVRASAFAFSALR